MAHSIVLAIACALAVPPSENLPPVDWKTVYRVELPPGSPVGEASIREHAIAWHPAKKKYYLAADVVALDNPHHPNTYNTDIHLWSSADLSRWTYHGVAVAKGIPDGTYDGYGASSPAGMVFWKGRLYVPFSARRTSAFSQRSIGLAWSFEDPEILPWEKAKAPISDTPGEDDDPALVVTGEEDCLHLYHRTTAPGGYHIVHTVSARPEESGSWPPAQPVTRLPAEVRAQELTAAFWLDGACHLMTIEHFFKGGIQIAHLRASQPDARFHSADPATRYLPAKAQPNSRIYSGHITPVIRDGRLVAFFWTVTQGPKRYGLQGHPVVLEGEKLH